MVSLASDTRASRVFNSSISFLIMLSVTIVIVNTFDVPLRLLAINALIQLLITVVFTLEYLLRLWVADLARPELLPGQARLGFVFSFNSLIDLLAIVPFWLFFFVPFDLRFLAAFRILRIMRLLRLSFYSKALSVVGSVLKSSARRLVAALLLLVLLMLIASILMYNAEHAVQPEVFDNALSGFWWAMQTITTIGYGDIYPVTYLGKLLGIVIALLGVGMVAIPTGIISASFVEHERSSRAEEKRLEEDTLPKEDV